jgi:hypothetical protein
MEGCKGKITCIDVDYVGRLVVPPKGECLTFALIQVPSKKCHMNNEEIFHNILIKHTNVNVKLCVQDPP